MRMINKIIIIVVSIISYVLAFYNLKNKLLVRFLICIGILPVMLIPCILKKLKVNIDNKLELSYLLFIVLAYFLGTIVNLYDKLYCYDTIMHFLSGVFEAYIATKFINSKNKIIYILFILGFTSLVSVSWEIFEYISSIIFKVDPQKVLTTGVNDTMKDLIVAIIGACIVIIWKKRECNE